MTVAPATRRGACSLPRLWAWFTGLLLLNELGTNVYGLLDMFVGTKVLNSLSDDAHAAVQSLALDGLLMLGMAYYYQQRAARAKRHFSIALRDEDSRESASQWLLLLDRELAANAQQPEPESVL